MRRFYLQIMSTNIAIPTSFSASKFWFLSDGGRYAASPDKVGRINNEAENRACNFVSLGWRKIRRFPPEINCRNN